MRSWAFALRVATGMIAAWLLGMLFVELGEEISGTFLGVVERELMALIAANREADDTMFMLVLTFLGSAVVYIVIGGIVTAVLWGRGERLTAAMVVIVGVGAGLLAYGLKYAYDRPRPDISPIVGSPLASFPSGHALASTAIYGFFAYLIARRLRWYWRPLIWASYVALTLGISISRIYLGIHWPTDVIGGILAGAVWLAACMLAHDVLMRLGERRAEKE